MSSSPTLTSSTLDMSIGVGLMMQLLDCQPVAGEQATLFKRGRYMVNHQNFPQVQDKRILRTTDDAMMSQYGAICRVHWFSHIGSII